LVVCDGGKSMNFKKGLTGGEVSASCVNFDIPDSLMEIICFDIIYFISGNESQL
jgi:hypothetical protein